MYAAVAIIPANACIDSVRAGLLPHLVSSESGLFGESEEISGGCRNFKSGFHWAKAIIAAGGGCRASGAS